MKFKEINIDLGVRTARQFLIQEKHQLLKMTLLEVCLEERIVLSINMDLEVSRNYLLWIIQPEMTVS